MKLKDTFAVHRSKTLVSLFREKPFQGQHPGKAKVIIFGSDANFPSDIEQHQRFLLLTQEYLEDGVAFWKKYHVHHPFIINNSKKLSSEFSGVEHYPPQNKGGVPYHKTFEKLELPVDCADCISFVELLDVPTEGSTEQDEFWKLFDPEHAKWLDKQISSAPPKLILLSAGVLKNIQIGKNSNNEIFKWVPQSVEAKSPSKSKIIRLCTILDEKGYEVYKIPHFSSFIYLNKEMQKEILVGIRELIIRFCRFQL